MKKLVIIFSTTTIIFLTLLYLGSYDKAKSNEQKFWDWFISNSESLYNLDYRQDEVLNELTV